MVKTWMDASCGMFGRSPDFMNIFVTAFASAADEFGRRDKRFAENLRAYHKHIRENDICMTHTLVNPQVDRSKPVEKQDKDLAAKYGDAIEKGDYILDGKFREATDAYCRLVAANPAGAGQFTKIDPGIGKLLGVLSLQALPRRLQLDFRDVFLAYEGHQDFAVGPVVSRQCYRIAVHDLLGKFQVNAVNKRFCRWKVDYISAGSIFFRRTHGTLIAGYSKGYDHYYGND